MLNKDADNSEKIKLLQEAAVLGQFNHPNIVTLYGVVTLGKPVSHYGRYRYRGTFQLGLTQYGTPPCHCLLPETVTLNGDSIVFDFQ